MALAASAKPAPDDKGEPLNGSAVLRKIALTWPGSRFNCGLLSIIRAMMPATTGAAAEVPKNGSHLGLSKLVLVGPASGPVTSTIPSREKGSVCGGVMY